MKNKLQIRYIGLVALIVVGSLLASCAIEESLAAQVTPETIQQENPEFTPEAKEELNPVIEGEPNMPGQADSQSGQGETKDAVSGEAVDWVDYVNDNYGFTMKHPSVLVVMPPKAGQGDPPPVDQIFFQDEQVANSDVAELAPAAFSIRIFDNQEDLTASDWLVKHGRVSEEGAASLEEYIVDGVKGVQYCRSADIVPNCLIYVSHNLYLYEFIPGGIYGEEMLNSFRFGS